MAVAVAVAVVVAVAVAVAVPVCVAVAVGVGVGPGPPPFAVHKIVPLSPTAIPRSASLAKETSLRLAEVPLVWSFQAIPIFVVCKIRPPAPTANPKFVVFVTGKSTPSIG